MAPGLLLAETGAETVRQLARGYAAGRGMRVVNFHATPRYREAEFRAQIADYAARFDPVTPENFGDVFDGRDLAGRPKVMIVLFEGFRDNLDVVLPILEEHGMVGWFFLPAFFLDVPAEEQRAYAKRNVLHQPARDEYPGERIALTWQECRAIAARGHGFACHSGNHVELSPDSDAAFLEREIVEAKRVMERGLGQKVEIFCWLRGASTGINPNADTMLAEAGFSYLFSNFKIEKLR